MPVICVERDDELSFLHLKNVEVTFKGKQPRYPIGIDIVCGDSVAGCVEFAKTDSDALCWEANIHFPRDASLNVVIKESRAIKWRAKREFASVHFELSDIRGNENLMKDDGRGLVSVTLTFETPVKADVVVRKGAEDAIGLLKKKPVALEKLGKARDFIEVVKNFGDVLADVHPAVKAAVLAFNMLYEKFEDQETVHKDALDLIDDLQQFLPFTEVIDSATMRNEGARGAVKDFLRVFKETCDFIVQCSSSSILGDLMSSQASKIDDLKVDLRKAKEKYDWSIKTDVWKVNLKIEKIRDNDLLKPLRVSSLGPSGKEFYRTDSACLAGTRTDVLSRISQWAEASSGRKAFWLHGPPGSGKSAIANSVAHMLDSNRLLAGCLFCRRDDPDLRDAGKVIPSLATHLAGWHQPYSVQLLSALHGEERNRVASRTIQEQFDLLIKGPVLAVSSDDDIQAPNPLVIVIDGLEECGNNKGQRIQLARVLIQISGLVPWLKLFVTSRTLPELSQIFGGSADVLEELDLRQAGDPTDDIALYAKHRARVISQENGLEETWISDEQITALVENSQGRFTWISSVFSFIEGHTDVDYAVEVTLSAPFIDLDHGTGDLANLCMESLQKAERDLQNRRSV